MQGRDGLSVCSTDTRSCLQPLKEGCKVVLLLNCLMYSRTSTFFLSQGICGACYRWEKSSENCILNLKPEFLSRKLLTMQNGKSGSKAGYVWCESESFAGQLPLGAVHFAVAVETLLNLISCCCWLAVFYRAALWHGSGCSFEQTAGAPCLGFPSGTMGIIFPFIFAGLS